jgi:hypothetical protein
VPSEKHILQHAGVQLQCGLLEGPCQSEAGEAVWCTPQHLCATNGDGSGVGLVVAADAVEKRGLAGTVRAHQAEDSTRLDVETDFLKDLDATEVQVHAVEAQACRHPVPSCRINARDGSDHSRLLETDATDWKRNCQRFWMSLDSTVTVPCIRPARTP